MMPSKHRSTICTQLIALATIAALPVIAFSTGCVCTFGACMLFHEGHNRHAEPAAGARAAHEPEAWSGAVASWGTLREVLHEGKTEGRVRLDADNITPRTIGVGALEGLAGEITILDGRIFLSRAGASDKIETTSVPASDEKAALLFTADVPHWTRVRIDQDVSAEALDDYLATAVERAGLAHYPVVPFLVSGTFDRIEIHAVSGRCPHSASADDTPQFRPPALATQTNISGGLVGFFAPSGQGTVTHHGTRTHVHAILQSSDPAETLGGHVDAVALRAGSTLALPAHRLGSPGNSAVDPHQRSAR